MFLIHFGETMSKIKPRNYPSENNYSKWENKIKHEPTKFRKTEWFHELGKKTPFFLYKRAVN